MQVTPLLLSARGIRRLATGGVILGAFKDALTASIRPSASREKVRNTKPLKLQGTLEKWDMVNPHSWFHIQAEAKADVK